MTKKLPVMQETCIQSLELERFTKKEMVTPPAMPWKSMDRGLLGYRPWGSQSLTLLEQTKQDNNMSLKPANWCKYLSTPTMPFPV